MTIYRDTLVSPAMLIASGLMLLIAHACGLAAPVATALALVAFGATTEAIARVSQTNSTRLLLAANLCCYTSLYLLLIGAICDASLRGPRDGLTLLQGMDFGVSAFVMALVVRTSVAVLLKSGDAAMR